MFFSKICQEKPSYREEDDEDQDEHEVSQINSNRKSEFDELKIDEQPEDENAPQDGNNNNSLKGEHRKNNKVNQNDFILFHQKEY
jgi:hypothetical protein